MVFMLMMMLGQDDDRLVWPQPILYSNILIQIFYIEALSEAVKILKAEYLMAAIDEHKMDQAILFCRTKLDCDNLERYLCSRGGG